MKLRIFFFRQYTMRVTTDFPAEIATKMKKVKESYNQNNEFLKEHQFIFMKYFTEMMQFTRGMLVFNSTGTGKTISGASVVDFFIRNDPDRRIILLAPKSLMENFRRTMKTYMEKNPHAREEEKHEHYIEKALKKIKYISLGANNMFAQMERLDSDVFDDSIREFLNNEHMLEGTTLIVDECHNLSNSIVNGSKNGISLYDKIMNTRDIKLILLTATPMINSPFELVPIFNMLRGKIEDNTLLPESYANFAHLFIDREKREVKNKQKFMNRIFGLISYYGSEYFAKDSEDFPTQYETVIEKVPMSEYQFAQYETMRDIERKEEEKKYMGQQSKADRFSDKSSASSSYRVRSRQASNFAYPPDAYKNIHGKVKKFTEKITADDIGHLEIYSPKMKKLIQNLRGEGPDVIYSQFIPTVLRMALEADGYTEWNKQSGKKYAIISGEVRAEVRADIVNIWNNIGNIRGDVIKVLVITATGAEGLDLKYGRRVHIYEPFWNMARIEQVIARIVRYKSHEALPPAERNVQPYIYLSVYPADYPKKNIKELTTDEEIYETAVSNKYLINQFTKCLIEASVDCSVLITDEARQKYKCMRCTPTNMPLFYSDISVDMQTPNRCIDSEPKKISVHEVILPGIEEKFYYSIEDGEVKIFYFSDKIDGYVPLPKTHKYYVDLSRKILVRDNV